MEATDVQTDTDTDSSDTLNANWHAVLVVEGVRTSDRREFVPGSLRWRTLPIPLLMQLQTAEQHKGSVIVGRIDRIERIDAELHGWGVFDMKSEHGKEAQRLVSEQMMRGVSIDAEVLEINKERLMAEDDGEIALIIEEAKIGAATLVSFQAFPQAVIALSDMDIPPATEDGRGEATITAARKPTPQEIAICRSECGDDENCMSSCLEKKTAASRYSLLDHALLAHAESSGPPTSWFTNPELKELTPLIITRNGRLYSHAAGWNSCHVGYPSCMKAPRSHTNYAHYLVGAVLPADCDCDSPIATGVITLGTTHADSYADPESARRHYDNTGMAVADVTVGEDEHGIWVAGALRPGITDAQVRALRGSALSGDWRWIGGNLELVGLLAVNTPGFPIPRVAAAIESGVQISLVAAGIPEDIPTSTSDSNASPSELLADLKRELEEKEQEESEEGTEEEKQEDVDTGETAEPIPDAEPTPDNSDDPSPDTSTDPATDSTTNTITLTGAPPSQLLSELRSTPTPIPSPTP